MNFDTIALRSLAGTEHLGVEVRGLALATCSAAVLEALGRLIADRLVVVVRDANISRERFWEVCWHIGQIRGTELDYVPEVMPTQLEDVGDDRIDGGFYIRQGRNYMPGLGRVSGVRDEHGRRTGMFASGELLWHANQAAAATPAPLVAAQGWAGVEGSQTEIVETATLYTELDPELRQRLDGVRCVHHFSDGCIAPDMDAEENAMLQPNLVPEDGARTPLVKTTPGGRVGLAFHFNTVTAFEGIEASAAEQLRALLLERMFDPRFIYVHEWARHDLLFFDQIVCLHRRRQSDTSTRVLHRIALGFNKVLPDQPDYGLASPRD